MKFSRLLTAFGLAAMLSLPGTKGAESNAADVPSPRTDKNSEIAHEKLLAKAHQGRIDLYFIGDSITRRWGATDYPQFLENWRKNFFGWNAADFGWGADGIQHILWRLEHGELDGAIVGSLIAAGDPGAVHALQELGRWIGQACASLGAVLDPQLFVIGGGVAVAGDLLLDPIREAYIANLPARGYHPEPEFATAELVNDAGVVGAADLARIHSLSR
jgi:predicted NBD/HSP70 family sugar kinase